MTSPPKLDPLSELISAVLRKERADAFAKPTRRMSKRTVDKIISMSDANKKGKKE